MDQDLGAERPQVSHSLSLSLCHKSFHSAAQTILVSPLFPFDTMGMNYIKAGLVNLAGASCKRHWELKLCDTMRIILPCSVCLVQLLRHMQDLSLSLSLFFSATSL